MPTRRLARFTLLLLLCAVSLRAQDNVYFGNLHSHTSYSDGSGKPAQAYKHARDVAHVDFLAITEHNHVLAEQGAPDDRRDGILIAKDHSLYSGAAATSLISAARVANKDGTFVALYGQEFSSISSGNHINVFEIPDVITVPNGAFDQLVTLLDTVRDSRTKQPIVQLNHPGLNTKNPAKDYGEDDFASDAEWIDKMGKFTRTIAILNGPHDTKTLGNRPPSSLEHQYLHYLSLGFQVAPTADQDNHYQTWGDATVARTAVIAPALTKANILDAIDQRHVYATEDKNLRLIFKIDGHLMGDRISPPAVGTPLDIKYSIKDDDEPDAGYSIEVFSGVVGQDEAAVIDKLEVEGDTPTGQIDSVKYDGGNEYIFFKITQINEDGVKDHAWTAPVWFASGSSPSPPPLLTPGPTGTQVCAAGDHFVASKKRSIYHCSSCRDAQNISPANKVEDADAVRGRTLHENCPRK
jgi:trimeric autotransporter adhesin